MGLPTSPGKQQQVMECLSHLIYAFQSAEAFQSLLNTSSSSSEASATRVAPGTESSRGDDNNYIAKRTGNKSRLRDDSDDSSGDDHDFGLKNHSSARAVGPMIPSAAQLAEAKLLTKV